MMCINKFRHTVLLLTATFLFAGIASAQEKQNSSCKKGIAAQYPGDEGIEKHQSVVFTENFEASSIADVVANWSWARGDKDNRLSLDAIPGPEGSTGNKSLKMTIRREESERNAGSDLIKIFDERYEQLFLRFYVKFADDYGYNHHFTSLSGVVDPIPAPGGSAGKKPTRHFSSTIDQLTGNINGTGPATTPPGYWSFYTYWPEMNSWQSPEGKPDGRPNPYYGNNFMPKDPVPAKRGEWQCVEIMIRVNSSPDKADGAHAFWIDGEQVGRWDPLEINPVMGYWRGDRFISNPDHEKAESFQGIRWRNFEDKELFEKLKINRLRVQNYVSGTSWKNVDRYAEEHPDFKINLQEATVWKDHIVVATEYIGPITLKNSGNQLIPVSAPGNYAQAGAVYKLTNDIVSERSAIFLGKDVTLDLNGYTITYAGGDYEHVPNYGFEEGIIGWDISKAPGAKVVNTAEVHAFIGDKILSLEKGDEITSSYINLPVANRSYFAMCGITGRYYHDMGGDLKNDMKISIYVDDEQGNEVRSVNEYSDSTIVGCPVINRSARLGGGFVFAHLKDLPAGKYRIRVKAETDCLVDQIDIRPAMDVGIGIVEITHPYGHYNHFYDIVHSAFYDYTENFKNGKPVDGIPKVEGKGTVTIKNGTIKSGTRGIASWGIQSTANDVRIILDSVIIINQGINATAVDVPHATITNCIFKVDNPFIINRHGSQFYAVDLRGTKTSEVSYSEFYGGQGNLVIKGLESKIHHNYFVNRQTVTNHYSIMAMGDGSMIFENKFEPEIGSALEIFRHKNIEIFNNEFIIKASPPSCEYADRYSTNAIRVADYGSEWGSPRGAYGNRIYNNKFHITGKKFKEYPDYIPVVNAFFYSTSAGDNYIFGNEIIVVQEDPDTDAEAFAFYIGNARGGQLYNNRIISNVTPIWVACGYGTAIQTKIFNNTFIKAPNAPFFKPVRMGSFEQKICVAENVEFRSNEFQGLEFAIDATPQNHSYKVSWTLNINSENPGSEVQIFDKTGEKIISQKLDKNGQMNIELPEYSVDGDEKKFFSPYTIVAAKKKKTVHLNQNSKIEL